MSDMEETEGAEGAGVPAAPHRVIGTPPPSPRLLGSAPVDLAAAAQGGAAFLAARTSSSVLLKPLAAPGFVGLYQVNVQIPAGVPAGDAVPIALTISSLPANPITIAVDSGV